MSPEVATKIVRGRSPGVQALQALRQKTRAEVLESRRRPVVELEREQAVRRTRDRSRRRVDAERRLRDLRQLRLERIAREESGQGGARDIGQARQRAHRGNVHARQPRGNVQPAVGRQALADGLAHRDLGRAAACARVSQDRHQAFTTRAPKFSSGEIQQSDFSPCSANAATMAPRTASAC